MRISHLLFCSAAALVLAAHPLMAQNWLVDQKRSTVGIVGHKPTGPLSGSVEKWDGKIIFDPDHLDTSHVTVSIDTSSIKTNDTKWNSVLPGPDWLSSSAFPVATFESTSITRTGGNAYAADGSVTIRGIRHPVTLPFTVDLNGNTAHATGTLSLFRTDFNIGGLMENTPDFGITIGVTFDLTATK